MSENSDPPRPPPGQVPPRPPGPPPGQPRRVRPQSSLPVWPRPATQFEQYREAYDEEDVPGIGDEAIYDPAGHALAARSDEFTVVLSYSGSNEAVTREALVALASIAFERLGAG
jgi:hypothetical protein